VEQVTKLDAHGSVPYVAEALTRLREEVGNQSTVLGFVGAPFTLATYIVEGGSSKNYTHMKRLMFTQPEVLHAFLSKMADNIADYVRYQVLLFFCTCHLTHAFCLMQAIVALAKRNIKSTATAVGRLCSSLTQARLLGVASIGRGCSM